MVANHVHDDPVFGVCLWLRVFDRSDVHVQIRVSKRIPIVLEDTRSASGYISPSPLQVIRQCDVKLNLIVNPYATCIVDAGSLSIHLLLDVSWPQVAM